MRSLLSKITIVLACSVGLLLSSPLVDTASALRDCSDPPGDAGDIRFNEEGELERCEQNEDGVYRWAPLRSPAPDSPTIDPPAQVAPPVPIPVAPGGGAGAPGGGGHAGGVGGGVGGGGGTPGVVGGGAGACTASYAVAVAMNPSRSTTLLMEFGDTGLYSNSETRSIPQGTGSVTFQFTHEFNPSVFNFQPFLVHSTFGVQAAAGAGGDWAGVI